MNVLDKCKELLKNYTLCDHCLGRQFALLGYGLDNGTRGKALKGALCLQIDLELKGANNKDGIIDLENLAKNGKYEPARALLEKLGKKVEDEMKTCSICGDVFTNLDDFIQIARKKIQEIEFKTFLIGSISVDEIIEKEDQMRANHKLQHGESIKAELNREVGKKMLKVLSPDKEPDFGNPNMFLIMDYKSKDVFVQLNPLFISGRYCKYSRSIPQTKWLCRECKGKGCDRCAGTGKQYPTSVSEIIGDVILKKTKGIDFKFHGAGREDIDAMMLGEGRQFVIEIKEPKLRFLDLKQLEKEINESAGGQVEVKNLQPSNKDTVHRIKLNSPMAKKKYRALVELGKPIDSDQIEAIEAKFQEITIKQQTPLRVLHRRVDKIRSKKIYSVKGKRESDTLIELEILA
ncbi:MAG: tRNA pseudouridine(54/55) synthase Pus10, partial [Candidatus Helarchaeota archaeon]